jgi:type I restriction enzyme S subunit
MKSSWQKIRLKNVATIVGGGTPSTKHANYWGGDIPWLTPKDLSNHQKVYVSCGERNISREGLDASSAKLVPPGTVLFTSRAPIGYLAIAEREVSTNQGFKSLVLKDGYDSRFFYYLLRFYTPEIKMISTGSIFKEVSGSVLGHFEVSIPDYIEQKKIASMLSVLDDHITLLRETNATLEAIAQTLFKSWFVNFDPVRAKAEGRVPEGIDAETAALFPDCFEKLELGMMPKGWKAFRVSDVVEIIKGKSYSSKDLVEIASTALVTLKSFARGGGFRLDGFKPYIGSYNQSQVIKSGDLIVAYTDVTQAAELIGKPAIVVNIQEFDTLVASLDVGIIKPRVKSVSRQFLYGLFKTSLFQSHTLAHTSGTTVLHLSKDAVGSFEFVCPERKIMEAFTTIAELIARQNQNNIDEIRTLTTLRDKLLPKLISGQLRLPEIDAGINKAAI